MKATKNKYFYFGKQSPTDPDLTEFEGDQDGWEDGWNYRIVVDAEFECLEIENRFGDDVTVSFDSLWQLTQTLNKVQAELVTSLIGAPNNA